MLQLFLTCMVAFMALSQSSIIEVVRVDEIVPLLSAWMSERPAHFAEAAGRIAEFMPTKNLQGAVGNAVQAVQNPFSGASGGGATLMKNMGIGKQVPMLGSLMTPLSTISELMQSPETPTLAPIAPPEEASRMAANLGIKAGATKNAFTALAAIPSHAFATNANAIGAALESGSQQLLATPTEINNLLQFQHSLFESFLAGSNEGSGAVPPQSLRDDIMRLTKIQPHLAALLPQMDNPGASGAFISLGRAFQKLKGVGAAGANTPESGDSTTMELAFANLVYNFLHSISGFAQDS